MESAVTEHRSTQRLSHVLEADADIGTPHSILLASESRL